MPKWINSIRSLLALVIAGGVFTYLSVIGKIDPKDVVIIVTMVMVFYFTKARSEIQK